MLAAIFVFTLLKMIIVVSTALFVPGESLISQRVQLSEETTSAALPALSMRTGIIGAPTAAPKPWKRRG